ncbi:MAG: hypothetical protein Q7W56_12455 [Candidatus Latescibacteria bacterium]|nr:hypothetical protein [Candidatus Latescibacterota bacterium]
MELERRDKVEILMMKYESHSADLRNRTEYDYKLISGYVTLSIVVGAWIAKSPLSAIAIKIGFYALMVALAFFVIQLLKSNQKRREVVIDTIRNVNKALGFYEAGVYHDGVINPGPSGQKHMLWLRWQVAIIILILFAQFVLVFWGVGA